MADFSGRTYPVLAFQSNCDELNRAFRIALGDLASSTILYQSGLIATPQPMIMAGLDYDSPWTRDAAINSWNAGSLLAPEIARNTLQGVLERSGKSVVIGGQYWDKIIWATAAWHHYLVTGDAAFLALAADATELTLGALEREEFDEQMGLFRGGACFQDGVSGYPDRYVKGHESSGPITRWAETNPEERNPAGVGLPMMVASTNCLYYSAYRCLARMLAQLGRPGVKESEQKGERLRNSIRKTLWNGKTAQLAYMIDPWETCVSQEGLGISFALLFGLLEADEADGAIAGQHITPQGIPCVWPTFPRYATSDGHGMGRHSGTIWPQVQGFWGEAVARHGRPDMLLHELMSLARHAGRDAQFTEIYHPASGEIYGGRQEPETSEPTDASFCPYPLPLEKPVLGGDNLLAWRSCRRQTWSATAFLRLIFSGLIGMRFEEDGICFQPTMGMPVQELQLLGLPYRDAILQIEVKGTGQKIREVRLNGKQVTKLKIGSDAKGEQRIEMVLTDS